MDHLGMWSPQRPWTGHILEALEAGADLDGIVTAAGGPDRLGRVRLFLFQLWEMGHVDLGFPAPPEQFDGRYKVVRELGRGGVGVAWLCDDNGKPCVVKHGWNYFISTNGADRLMRREAETMAAFDHDGIVRLHDQFEHDGQLHIVRDYAAGPPAFEFRDALAADLAGFAANYADILQHIQSKGYLLMDHRPANLHLRGDAPTDGLQLVDVGVCKPMRDDGQARPRKGIGSPGYSAPEVKRGRAGVHSEAFGLGCLLFDLAAGRRPLKGWTADDMRETLDDHPAANVILALTHAEPDQRQTLDWAVSELQRLGV